MKRAALNASLVMIFISLAYLFLYPGGEALLEGRTDTMISDGTDPAPLPYAYDQMVHTWHEKPHRIFYGAIHVDAADPQYGANYWFPWNERVAVILGSYFVPIEQLYGVFLFGLLLMNAFCMYLLGRYLGWARTISFGLALAWGFNCYTRARAKVHGALAGTYHLPLIFLGLYLIVRGRSKRSVALAALALLVAASVAHYYLVMCVLLSPLFVLFVWIQPEFKADRKRIAKRFVIAVLPAVAFIGFNRFVLLPSDANITGDQLIEIDTPQPQEIESFLRVFYAHPIDYLTGDISLNHDKGRPITTDLNPLREMINDHVVETLMAGNTHERTNGIRWLILGISVAAITMIFVNRRRSNPQLSANNCFFLGFAFVCLWLSFSPDVPFRGTGLSFWVYWLIPKIRVANRSGIGVHFSLLMLCGFFLTSLPQSKWRRFWFLPGVFPLLLFLDYFPIQGMPMAPVAPAYAELGRDKGICETGMFFPTVNPMTEQINHYQMAQRIRGSDCKILNTMKNIKELSILLQLFPPIPQFVGMIGREPRIDRALDRLVECVPLNWIVFHQAIPQAWARESCQRWGWALHSDGSCIAPNRARAMTKLPSQCF